MGKPKNGATAMTQISAPLQVRMYLMNLILLSKIRLPSAMALTIVEKLSSNKIRFAASLLTSVPAIPMAMPIVAALSEGASFTPSPVMAVKCPFCWRACTMRNFCSGATRA